jgi:hypothetical protein
MSRLLQGHDAQGAWGCGRRERRAGNEIVA